MTYICLRKSVFNMAFAEINPNIKLYELVDRNFQTLGFLERLGIHGNFGDKTVEDICASLGMNPSSFMLLYNFYVDEHFKPSERMLRDSSVEDVIEYLHSSHEYYLNTALKSLSDLLEKLLLPCSEAQKKVFRKFYDEYEEELNRHFGFEEQHVMPYARTLMDGNGRKRSTLESFTDDHNSINEKISDLKSLVMNSLPEGCDAALRMQTLYLICALEYDLERHTAIEEEVLSPMLEMLEMLNKEIADQYNISTYTVISHRKNITRKTGIKSVAGLTVYALLNGLIDINSVE